MELIKILERVYKQSNPTSKLLLSVEFSGGDIKKFIFDFEQEKQLLELKKIYEDYILNLNKNWNSWCNVELYMGKNMIIDYIKKYEYAEGDKLDDILNDFTHEYWLTSKNYDFFDRVSSTKITYFDENGIEWNCESK